MGRIHRVVAVGCPHHITQRGNFRRQVFFDDEDRHTYRDLLAAAASQADLAVLGFCLISPTGNSKPNSGTVGLTKRQS